MHAAKAKISINDDRLPRQVHPANGLTDPSTQRQPVNRGVQLSFASSWRDERALQDAAVEITRPLLRGERLREFRRFAGIREKRPPAERDGFSPPIKW